MPQQPRDEPHRDIHAEELNVMTEYVIDPDRVAEALLARIDKMADERARFRRSLIYSVEVIEAPELD
jgi:hypothetical protein